MISDTSDYTTKQKYISHNPDELRVKWQEYLDLLHKTDTVKNEVNLYIYFLHTEEGYTKSQIADLLESHYTGKKLTRERIGQIIGQVSKSIRSGGEKS